jgi:exosome complex exonuclease RRP6
MPTTVPELLSLFGGPGGVSGGVPPVLRRRAGELAGVIRSAMEAATSKSGEQASGLGRDEEREMGGLVAVAEDSTMVDTTTTSLSAVESTSESRLWAVPTSSPTSVATATSRSSLFGFGMAEQQTHAQVAASPSGMGGTRTFAAAGSILFGSALAGVSFSFGSGGDLTYSSYFLVWVCSYPPSRHSALRSCFLHLVSYLTS